MSQSVREQLEPLIRAAGIRHVARESGVHHGVLCEWINGQSNSLRVDQLEAIAAVLGLRVALVKVRNPA